MDQIAGSPYWICQFDKDGGLDGHQHRRPGRRGSPVRG